MLGVRGLIGNLSEARQRDAACRSSGRISSRQRRRCAGHRRCRAGRTSRQTCFSRRAMCSAGFSRLLLKRIAPQLEGLADRLASPDAAFLDVGVGVAALSIAMVRQWPRLRVVGVDPGGRRSRSVGATWKPPDLPVRSTCAKPPPRTFPTPTPSTSPGSRACSSRNDRSPRSSSVSRGPCARAAGCSSRLMNPDSEPLAASIKRFRTTLWGGSVLDPDAVRALLTNNGLVDVRLLPSPPAATVAFAVGGR